LLFIVISVLQLPLYAVDVLSVMNDGEVYTPSLVYSNMHDSSSLNYDLVSSTLHDLLRAGFVSLAGDQKGKYVKIKEVDDFWMMPDWKKVFSDGCLLMEEHYPSVYEEWKELQVI